MMRRSLPAVTATVAVIASMLVASPAAAEPAVRDVRPIGHVAADVGSDDGAATVSDDAHPVEPDVELVTFDEVSSTAEEVDPDTDPDTAETSPPAEPVDAADTVDGSDGDTHDGDEHDGDTHEGDDEAHVHGESGEARSEQVYASATTADLAIVGVSWDLGTAPDDLVVESRTRTGDDWTDWESLVIEPNEAPDDAVDSGARDGTSALAVIDVDEVEVRLSSDVSLPTGARLGVVDPGESSADADVPATPTTSQTGSSGSARPGGAAGRGIAQPAGSLAPAGVAVNGGVMASDVTLAAATGTARPTIYSRAQWGADESMMTWTPSQGRVQGIDIHHTVNANNYTSAQVPALLRGIYSYHAQDWGRGWGDIGYNFIVDRFGRIWEGRYGGVDAAPVGAHATGLNSNFSGVSLLGNFDITPVPSAMFIAVARVAAWKLYLHGVTTAYGTVTVDAGTFNRINGHRDSKQTTCPGKYMYNRLGEMRERISSYLGAFSGRSLDRDIDGDGFADLVVRSGTSVSLMSTVDQGVLSFSGRGTGWSRTKTTSAGDVNGDGYPDVYMIRGDGRMYLYLSTSSGKLSTSPSRSVSHNWGSVSAVAGGVDWDGDGIDDVVTRRAGGVLWLNRGTGGGALQAATRLSTASWTGFDSITLVEDFSSGRPALLARKKTTGTLSAYVRSSAGGLGSARAIGTSTWRDAAFIAGTPDVVGAAGGDILMVKTNGELWLVPGTGTGSVVARGMVYLGRAPSDTRRVIPFERTDGVAGFFAVRDNSTHSMRRWLFRWTARAYVDLKPTGITVGSSDRVVAAGDWNDDGRPDLMVVRSNGRLMLHVGTGGGRFAATGRQVATGWDSFSAVVGAPNFRGDGVAGLIAWHRSSGRLWFYPSDGDDGYRTRVMISDGATGMDMLVNASRWNGGGATDLLMRGADSKRLFHYDGNGPGLAFAPRSTSPTYGSMTAIVGVGDVTRDGKPDLVMTTSAGGLRIYAGDGRGGVTLWRELTTWPRSGSLS